MKSLSRKQLFALLGSTPPARLDAVARELGALEREVTILAADSSGFSRKTFEHGIVRFLANMTAVYDRVIPLVLRHGGQVTTQNADNILAVFARPHDALAAALATHALLARRDRRVAAHDRYELCLGIHHGTVLRLRDDVFGAAVNVCAKIGEDVAAAGETLVTDAIVLRASDRFRFERRGSTTIGGVRIPLHRLVGRT